MGIGLGEKLYTAGFVELLEEFDDLGRVVFELLDGAAGERESAFEVAWIGFCHLYEGFKCGNVGAFGCFTDGARVFVIIVVIVVRADVEETVTLQVDVLVYLEI